MLKTGKNPISTILRLSSRVENDTTHRVFWAINRTFTHM